MTDRREVSWEEWIRGAEDPRGVGEKPEALDDLLVLDLSYANFGGFLCSTFLAELGAEVIKIEPPDGDPARFWSPYGLYHKGEGLAYLAEGRNKYYTTLNVEAEAGREVYRALAQRADVVIETFQPALADGWRFGYRQLRELNPGLIYVALSSYGHFGPKAPSGKPAADVTAQALSGLVSITGEPQGKEDRPYAVPTKVGSWFASYAAGAWSAIGVLVALHYRHRTGKGQMIDISGTEAIMRFMEYTVLWYQVAGRVRDRIGFFDRAVFPYTFIRVKDGYGFIAGYTDPNFAALCRIMGRPELADDPRFRTTVDRTQPENESALHQEIENWSVNFTAQEILEKVLSDPGPGIVVFGKVDTPEETLQEANWWERGCFQRVQDPMYGEILLQMPVWKMTETPPRLKWACRPPGYHNAHVYLKYLGYGRSRLGELKAQGII
ncbi:MAG: CaiB/BaiF CoA transferase family protein [Candidatus Methylomirabilales bacterium]